MWVDVALAKLRLDAKRTLGLPRDYSDEERLVREWKEVPPEIKTRMLSERFLQANLLAHAFERSMTVLALSSVLPAEFFVEILIAAEKSGAARRLCRDVRMTYKRLDVAQIATNALGGWVESGTNVPLEDIEFGQGSLIAAKLATLLAYSAVVFEDAISVLLPTSLVAVGRSLASHEDVAVWRGDGTAAFGGITGFLNASTNAVSLPAGKTSFSNATADDYRSLRDAVPVGKREGASFMLSPSSVSNLQGQKDLQGNTILSIDGSNQLTLWQHPVEIIGALEGVVDGPNTPFACFGNPQEMLFGVRRDLKVETMGVGLVQNAGGSLITANAIQADLLIAMISERVGAKLMDTTAISVLKTAAV
jgi:HK97 family phage major capsid protein